VDAGSDLDALVETCMRDEETGSSSAATNDDDDSASTTEPAACAVWDAQAYHQYVADERAVEGDAVPLVLAGAAARRVGLLRRPLDCRRAQVQQRARPELAEAAPRVPRGA
jgi:hypothetical protein